MHEVSNPLQWSAPSHAPPLIVPVQLAVTGWNASTHELSDPLQWSAASWSHTLP
jgi:hypothetical protein